MHETSPSTVPYLQTRCFQGSWLLRRTENASRGFHMLLRVAGCRQKISTPRLWNINHITFHEQRRSVFAKDFPAVQGRLTHVQRLFTWNPSPLQSSKFAVEYLLLPPRSALGAVRPRLTPSASAQHLRPPTRLFYDFHTSG